MMMRHLTAIGETYAQTTLEDAAWNLWHVNPSQASTSTSSSSLNNPNPFTNIVRHQGGHNTGVGGGSLIRTMPTPLVPDVDLSNIIAMVETVREVLPHVPDELILQG
ncbi:E3 ubiquitin protein ligase RIN2-like [Lactuca sativa]|uniref:E3 ubiquitin protein ligase RIN2-like n=1 Tax=Lactuca sativa TaxID=4236 RepID=UPI0022AED6A8|nr:E3 ubiquitin protein ligase RIN2-like [Lactuca sativa]